MTRKIPYERLKAFGFDMTTVNRAVGQLVFIGVMDPTDQEILQQIQRMLRAERGERVADPEDNSEEESENGARRKKRKTRKAEGL